MRVFATTAHGPGRARGAIISGPPRTIRARPGGSARLHPEPDRHRSRQTRDKGVSAVVSAGAGQECVPRGRPDRTYCRYLPA